MIHFIVITCILLTLNVYQVNVIATRICEGRSLKNLTYKGLGDEYLEYIEPDLQNYIHMLVGPEPTWFKQITKTL